MFFGKLFSNKDTEQEKETQTQDPNNMMEIIYLEHYKGIKDVAVKDLDDAGVDLRAAINDTVTLEPGEDLKIPTGIKIHIGSHTIHKMYADLGIYGCILPRSGLGFKHYIRLANTAGVIDANYQGEIMVKVRNEGNGPLTISRGDRICQLIFNTYIKGVGFKNVLEFSEDTSRGAKGFGASGVK